MTTAPRSYADFTICYTVLDGNMFNEDTRKINVFASCEKYAEMVTKAIQSEYPGIKVDMAIQTNAEGYNRESIVTGPDLDSFDDEREIQGRFEQVMENIFTSCKWVVKSR